MTFKKNVFSASRWTAASAFLVTGLQVLQTAVLARLLTPEEFGLMAVAAAVIAVLALIMDMGLSQAVIHYDCIPAKHLSSMYWLNMVLAFVCMLAIIALAPILARTYHSHSLAALLQWTSLIFPLTAAGQQLRASAAKDLRFDTLARIEVISATASLFCALTAALLGNGIYALVIAILVNSASSSILSWALLSKRYRPSLHLNVHEVRPYLGFGIYLAGESVANSFHRNADVFAGGLVVGPGAIGIYSVPRDLSLRMAMVINTIATRVGFPAMSQVKQDRARLQSIFLQTLRMTASLNFPAYVALGLFANELVALLYGPKWDAAAVYLQILAAWGLVRSTGNPVGSLLYATGRTKRAFWWNMGLLVTLAPLYWVIANDYNLLGLAFGVLLLQVLLVIPAWKVLVQPCCGVTLQAYLLEFLPPLLCALSAGGVAWLTTHNLPLGTLRLLIGCSAGAISYLVFSWVFNRRWIATMMELLRLNKPHLR